MGSDISTCKPSEEGADDFDEWDFCGRQKEISEIVDLINSKSVKTLLIHGAKKIGKSRVLKQVIVDDRLNDYQVKIYVDFDMFFEPNLAQTVDFIQQFCAAVDVELKEELGVCNRCNLCAKGKERSCVIKRVTALLALGMKQQKLLLCFDNADNIWRSELKEEFLNFCNTVTTKCKNTKMMITSTVRSHMTSKGSEMYLLRRMEPLDLKKLLIQVMQHSHLVESNTSVDTEDPLLNAIASLCDGIPSCALTLGTILKEDDGLIEPIDLVQLLLTNFLDTLNPDLFPEEDRPAKMYQRELERDVFKAFARTWLYDISEKIEGTEITIQDAITAVEERDTPVATGDFKWEGLRKYLDHSIFQNVDRKKALSIEMLFKDLLVKASTIIEDNDGDGLKLTHFVGEKNLKLIKEKIRLIGLEMDKEELINAKMIEKRLRSTFQQTNKLGTDRSGEENEDDSGHSSTEDDHNEDHLLEKLKGLSGFSDEQFSKPDNDQYDSTSGPYGMYYQADPEYGLTSNSGEKMNIVNTGNNYRNDNPLTSDTRSVSHTDNIKVQHNQFMGTTTEEEYLRSGSKYTQEATSILSNTFPTTELRKGIRSKEGISTHPKLERTSSENKVCPTPPNRMSSEDYENADLPNETVSTKEASRTILKKDSESCMRYSGSSTDSGEFKLNLENKKSGKGY